MHLKDISDQEESRISLPSASDEIKDGSSVVLHEIENGKTIDGKEERERKGGYICEPFSIQREIGKSDIEETGRIENEKRNEGLEDKSINVRSK